MATYTIHTGFIKFINHVSYSYVFENSFYIYIVSCQGENIVIPMLDVEDQNAMYVVAFMGTQAVYLNLNLEYHRKCLAYSSNVA
jgi:hypothetical protein